MTEEEVQNHLCVLKMALDPKSPFCGMIDLHSKDGLLSLPLSDQRAVYNAMDEDLKALVFEKGKK